MLDNDQKEHKLTGLEPLRPYIIQIRAFNDKSHGPWTPPFVVTTGRAGNLERKSYLESQVVQGDLQKSGPGLKILKEK
uniref:Fibronectin type-III domain-containing protein n=1 Tax=Romanomermis culicivorax TaxID=13658 RepID=A0A915IMN8_ROMCU